MEILERRICSACKKEKEIADFTKDKSQKGGYGYSCKKCRKEKDTIWRQKNPDKIKEQNFKRTDKRREFYQSENGVKSSRKAHLKKKYGITLEEYNKIYNIQNMVCAICNSKESCIRNKFLAVDHCHENDKIRGLLCSNCNRALGLFKDDLKILENAIKYLLKHKN